MSRPASPCTFTSLEADSLLAAIDRYRQELEANDGNAAELSALSRAEGKVARARRTGSNPL